MKVTLEQTKERRDIAGYCRHCRGKGEPVALAPDGFVHAAAEDGTTLCGMTIGKRWWRL